MAMKSRGWNHDKNKPEKKLVDFLEDKINSINRRIYDATGVNIQPIYYVAGYKEEDEMQRPYNLSKLLYLILENTPKNKRLAYASHMSSDNEMWSDNDELKDYNEEIRRSFIETIMDSINSGGEMGREIGEMLGMGTTGELIGKVAGGIVGGIQALGSLIDSFFD